MSVCSVSRAFQPTLLAVTRSDLARPWSFVSHGSFNPRSSRSRGATPRRPAGVLRQAVSTHAPRGHEERLTGRRYLITAAQFQPTLLAVTRSDVEVASGRVPAAVSTHAPRGHEERQRPRAEFHAPRVVSTHAPRGHEERRRKMRTFAEQFEFQPTLLAVTRSDRRQWGRRRRLRRFNPRSSRSRGATGLRGSLCVPLDVSTHAPRGHEERPR